MLNISGFIEDKQLKKYTGVEPEEFYLLLNDFKEVNKNEPDDISELSQRLFMGLAYLKDQVSLKELTDLFEISEADFNLQGRKAATILIGLLTKPLNTENYEKYQEVLSYYQYRIDKLGGIAIVADASISAVKSELRKKNNGLSLLNTLQDSVDAQMSISEIFETTLKKLNTSLRMDISAVLMMTPGSSSFHIEYQFGSNVQLNPEHTIAIENLKNKSDYALINKQSVENDFSKFIKERLGLPFFIAVPIFSHNSLFGVLVSGRLKELKPFFPRLDDSDVDLLKSLAAFISVSCTNANLYSTADRLVKERTQEVVKQKELIEEHQKEIVDSINYAQRIQRSMLSSNEMLDENLKDYFIFFQPKYIVSGDFYWAAPLANNQFALVTADSTGHGVPGAIMSMLNISCLKEAVKGNKLTSPSEILNYTRTQIIEHLSNDGSLEGGKDGMDCSLISFDFANNKLTYAAANNPVWIVRGKELLEFAPDKMSVGKHDKDTISFTQHTIDLQKGDIVYTLTDGMPDQFGGQKGKKFMYRQLKELLVSIAVLSMPEQKEALKQSFDNWMGTLEQVDDVTLIGVKV